MNVSTSELHLLTRYDIKLLIRCGEHPHEIKRNDSRRNLYKDRRGDVYIWRSNERDEPCEPEATGLNLREIVQRG